MQVVVAQSAKENIVNGRRMISIPLPPRRPYLSPKRRALKKFKAIVTFDRKRQAKSEEATHRLHQRKAMRRAWAFSLVINLLVFLLLYLIVAENRNESGGDGNLITVTNVVADTEKSGSSSASESDAESSKLAQEMKPSSTPPLAPKNLNLIAVISEVPQIEMTSLNFSTFDVPADPSLSSFSPSMTTKDRRKRRVRQSDPFAKNSKPTGKGSNAADVFGLKPMDPGGFFKGKTGGDGSDLILFLDISGSMKERSEAVGRYVEINFPKASIVEVGGCNFRGQNPALLRPMLNSKELKNRSQVAFVCDLQDGVDQNGVDMIGGLLLQDHNRKSFHVISFERSPNDILLGLIERSNGSFKKVH